MKGRKEGNILFNDTLNTFYLQLYGIGEEGQEVNMTQELFFAFSSLIFKWRVCGLLLCGCFFGFF